MLTPLKSDLENSNSLFKGIKMAWNKITEIRCYDLYLGILGEYVSDKESYFNDLNEDKRKIICEVFNSEYGRKKVFDFINATINSKSEIARVSLGILLLESYKRKELHFGEIEIIQALQEVTDEQIICLLITHDIYISRDSDFYNKISQEKYSKNISGKNKLNVFLTEQEFNLNIVKYKLIGIHTVEVIRTGLNKLVTLGVFHRPRGLSASGLGNDLIDLHHTHITENFLDVVKKGYNTIKRKQ